MSALTLNVPAGLPHQLEGWHDTTHKRELAVIGPLGTGKTLYLAVKGALLSLANFPCPGALIVPDYPTFNRIHRNEWPAILRNLGCPARITGAQNPVIIYPWGSKRFVYSADKWETIVGTNLSDAVGDEPAIWPKRAYERITDRIRHPEAPCRQLALAGTPEGLPSWFAEKFDIHEVVDGGHGWTRRTIRATCWHPDLADYPARLKETYLGDEALFDTYARGKFVPMHSGRCYAPFDRAEHVRRVPYSRHLDLYLTCDFNVAAMRWEVAQVSSGEIRFIDEIALGSSGSVAEAAHEFVRRYDQHGGGVTVCGDAAGKARTAATGRTCYDELLPILRARWPLLNVAVPGSNPPVRDRVNTVNHHLRGAGGYCVLVDPACVELAIDFEQNVWKQGTTDTDKRDPQRTHAAEAAGYLMHERFPLRPPAKVAVAKADDAEGYSDPMMEMAF